MKSLENSNLFKIGQKKSGNSHEDPRVPLYFWQQQHEIFCSSTTIKREPTVAFPWQHPTVSYFYSYIRSSTTSRKFIFELPWE